MDIETPNCDFLIMDFTDCTDFRKKYFREIGVISDSVYIFLFIYVLYG